MRNELHIVMVHKLNPTPVPALRFNHFADLLTPNKNHPHNLHEREQLVTLHTSASVRNNKESLRFAAWHMHTLSFSSAMDPRSDDVQSKQSMQLRNTSWQCLKPALHCHSALAMWNK